MMNALTTRTATTDYNSLIEIWSSAFASINEGDHRWTLNDALALSARGNPEWVDEKLGDLIATHIIDTIPSFPMIVRSGPGIMTPTLMEKALSQSLRHGVPDPLLSHRKIMELPKHHPARKALQQWLSTTIEKPSLEKFAIYVADAHLMHTTQPWAERKTHGRDGVYTLLKALDDH